MKNKINDLRNHLFEAIENLKDADPATIDQEINRAKAITEVAQVIVNSAKVEVEYLRTTGKQSSETDFLSETGVVTRQLN